MYAILILLGLAVLAGVSFGVTRFLAKRRTKALAALAGTWGFSFQPKADSMAVIPSGKLRLFTRGDSRACANVMWWTIDEVNVTHFDFTFTIGFYNHAHDRSQTVTMFKSSGVRFPAFALTPKGIFEKLDETIEFGFRLVCAETVRVLQWSRYVAIAFYAFALLDHPEPARLLSNCL